MFQLKTLRLDGCPIGNLGVKFLGRGQWPHLRALSIRRVRLTADSLSVLYKLSARWLKIDISDNVLSLRLRLLAKIECTCLICYEF